MIRALLSSRRIIRNGIVQITRNSSKCHKGLEGGIPGQNLPFPKSIGNPKKMTILFLSFFGVAFWAPYLLFIYMMHR